MTDRKAGIILVMERRNAKKHFEALEAVIEAYGLPISVEMIDGCCGFLWG